MDSREYIPRKALTTVREMTRSFPCVMITGARQVGKSTMLKQIMPEDMKYVTLDDFRKLKRAKEDPIGFLEELGTPLCIDEVQYAPTHIKFISSMIVKMFSKKISLIKTIKLNRIFIYLIFNNCPCSSAVNHCDVILKFATILSSPIN